MGRGTRDAAGGVIGRWIRHLEDHHPYTARHSRSVAGLMTLLAARMRVNETQTELLARCGLLHDLGKLAVPADLLDGSGELTSEDLQVIHAHSTEGAERVASTPSVAEIAPIVRAVHERWDGGGYPDGLAGESIPLPSRMLAIVDAFDAMTSHGRNYRKPMTHEQAVTCLQENAGSQFDPTLVDLFVEAVGPRDRGKQVRELQRDAYSRPATEAR